MSLKASCWYKALMAHFFVSPYSFGIRRWLFRNSTPINWPVFCLTSEVTKKDWYGTTRAVSKQSGNFRQFIWFDMFVFWISLTAQVEATLSSAQMIILDVPVRRRRLAGLAYRSLRVKYSLKFDEFNVSLRPYLGKNFRLFAQSLCCLLLLLLRSSTLNLTQDTMVDNFKLQREGRSGDALARNLVWVSSFQHLINSSLT